MLRLIVFNKGQVLCCSVVKYTSVKLVSNSTFTHYAAQHRVATDSSVGAILPFGGFYKPFPVYRVHSLQGCG